MMCPNKTNKNNVLSNIRIIIYIHTYDGHNNCYICIVDTYVAIFHLTYSASHTIVFCIRIHISRIYGAACKTCFSRLCKVFAH